MFLRSQPGKRGHGITITTPELCRQWYDEILEDYPNFTIVNYETSPFPFRAPLSQGADSSAQDLLALRRRCAGFSFAAKAAHASSSPHRIAPLDRKAPGNDENTVKCSKPKPNSAVTDRPRRNKRDFLHKK